MAVSGGTRKTADDRRRELINIGLRLLVERPIHELAIDEVAKQAGISRGLLFHYFPTKGDYYAAVVEAATRRILNQTKLPTDGDERTKLTAVVGGLVRFIRRRRANYVALVRGAAGGDVRNVELFDALRDELTERVLVAAGVVEPDLRTKLLARGWLAMAEEMAISSVESQIRADELIELLVDSFDRIVRAV
ncbi:TetR/AcrR family transcriptional regulator [Smaragdicoccus niigatensis]|uniref:TetR/AcrR family transcriptional regulator n=1 Tax=Smaragdicoccus niigatensis TaxID=359359 RepID=UPI00036F9E09|nr:TetR/AcrR family transcriptional regulator [Smaragdicoccus niigatensis]